MFENLWKCFVQTTAETHVLPCFFRFALKGRKNCFTVFITSLFPRARIPRRNVGYVEKYFTSPVQINIKRFHTLSLLDVEISLIHTVQPLYLWIWRYHYGLLTFRFRHSREGGLLQSVSPLFSFFNICKNSENIKLLPTVIATPEIPVSFFFWKKWRNVQKNLNCFMGSTNIGHTNPFSLYNKSVSRSSFY